jgi:TonB-dependent receptor
MATPLKLAGLLLLSSALTAPAAIAQTTGVAAQDAAAPAMPIDTQPEKAEQAAPEVSVPGSDIVVVGRRGANIQKAAPAVVSVLSAEDIKRTGEGNIAGALGRVTGLSVVGSGFVYVRGLGDRYSLALLNGSPLPSPEPLKRVVPLDLFPTNIVSSSLVQKSYSVNFPGEFGGGVINLTTSAVPKDKFLTVSGGIGANTVTTNSLGYTYYGSASDWTGFDDGSRNTPPALAAFLKSGERISSGNVDTQVIASQLVNFRNGVVQRWNHVAPNFSASVSGGTSFDIGDDVRLGLIATAGYSNKWQTRDALQQASLSSDLSLVDRDFRRVSTDNRIVANALLGLGLEFGDNKIRWTNLYIRDTLKRTRLGVGRRNSTDVDFMQQDTAWYERQLINTQLVGELKITPELNLDLRGGYANSQREAPGELSLEYVRTNSAADPFGQYFVNRLNNGNGGDATISFSDLNEDLWSGGADLTWRPISTLGLTAGYSYLNTKRTSSRRDFQFQASSTFPAAVSMFRPDLLLSPGIISPNVDPSTGRPPWTISLVDTNEGNPAFAAKLVNHAGYGKVNFQVTPEITIDGGVRYEWAEETVAPIQVFATPGASTAGTNLKNHYWLPAATVTWQINRDMQVRANYSKTIARPQFRELIYQFYFDPDTNRQYQGNPLLQDSKLTNAEGRFEWYFAKDQRFSIAGFYKKIDKPIEAFIAGSEFTTSFANAPSANLYGVEVEVQKFFDIADLWANPIFETRRLAVIANYTFTKSKLKVNANDTVAVFGASSTNATDFFRDGSSLTGQSDHLVNFQIGLEDTSSLSQQTLIVSYASKRVTSRGLANSGQPDVFEHPGLNLDFVLRQGFVFRGLNSELKFEARNILGTDYKEYQQSGSNRVYYNLYNIGTTLNASISIKF